MSAAGRCGGVRRQAASLQGPWPFLWSLRACHQKGKEPFSVFPLRKLSAQDQKQTEDSGVVETRRSESQYHSWLHKVFEATLGYVRPSFWTNNLENKNIKKNAAKTHFPTLPCALFSRGTIINSFLSSFFFLKYFMHKLYIPQLYVSSLKSTHHIKAHPPPVPP